MTEEVDPSDTSWMRQPYARGHRKHALLRDVAEAKLTQYEIAAKYGVSQPRISQMASHPTNAAIIAEIRANLDDEFAGIWIAQKKNRINEYRQMAEDIDTALSEMAVPDATLLRVRQTALRNVAEELAQLPNRVTVQNVDKRVNYSFDGVDPEDLR